MHIVLLTHPDFIGSNSQSRFARMLQEAYRQRGHHVDLRQPQPLLRRAIGTPPLAKWAGYVDQYVFFPPKLARQLRTDPADTLYVVCDQALGPWVPWIAHRPHVVHCHDLLALRSALGEIPENPTSATGRLYQRFIRRGFRRAQHFICISEKSRADLHRVGGVKAATAEVVYNGLNHAYGPMPPAEAATELARAGLVAPEAGLLLHVGGAQWYKNTSGVIALYEHFARRRSEQRRPVPALWMVSPTPSAEIARAIEALPAGCEVRFLPGLSAMALQALYSIALALLFPSLAEGFGWPIAEGLACGCLVVTTGEAPMTEVGGACASYLRRLPSAVHTTQWARAGAEVIEGLIDRPAHQREAAAKAGMEWARRYEPQCAIDSYLRIYKTVLDMHLSSPVCNPLLD